MKEHGTNGSLTVEASLIFPLVIMMLIPFLLLFKFLLVQQIVEDGLEGCVRQLAVESYVLERMSMIPEPAEEPVQAEAEKSNQLKEILDRFDQIFDENSWQTAAEGWGLNLAGQWLLKDQLQEWLREENLENWGIVNGWDGLSVQESRFFYTEEGHHALLKGVVTFQWDWPVSFWKPAEVRLERVCHGFMGEASAAGSDADNDQEETTETVYRIGQGNRYHQLSCYLIQKNGMRLTKEEAEQRGGKPCSRCRPDSQAVVYKTAAGTTYHTKDCSYLYPDVQPLPRQEAIRQGYTACEICWGGGYFHHGG